ncbi:hypothetical protein MLD38_021100 [Melastoma candidum]|uniref:Uncharacterized protein n=1 Tax=Melastoma candidum TaxID=119954 RepID=A0ACB9QF27_9MYRT|nr:hypothetical protein MLD38_021100 [Melastoma candidum]
MAMEEKGSKGGKGEEDAEGEEKRRLLGGVPVLDFDMLCSAMALQTQGKWTNLRGCEEEGGRGLCPGEVGGVLRMWEGEFLDCLEDRRLALQSACCPCYRFGNNMKRAGFGSSFVQGSFHLVLVSCALANAVAFAVTRRHYFLSLAVIFTLSVGAYQGFFRMQMRKKFNIKLFQHGPDDDPDLEPLQGSDSYLDDCFFHLVCPCCTLSLEARTLEMNNVQDGTWHGRGDTICITSYSDGKPSLSAALRKDGSGKSSVGLHFPCQGFSGAAPNHVSTYSGSTKFINPSYLATRLNLGMDAQILFGDYSVTLIVVGNQAIGI